MSRRPDWKASCVRLCSGNCSESESALINNEVDAVTAATNNQKDSVTASPEGILEAGDVSDGGPTSTQSVGMREKLNLASVQETSTVYSLESNVLISETTNDIAAKDAHYAKGYQQEKYYGHPLPWIFYFYKPRRNKHFGQNYHF